MVQSDKQPGYYTRKQKVDLAKAQGFPATKRLHVDWVAKGLLGQGNGRKKGVGALWSGQQLELWFALLRIHQQTHELDTLCSIPVFLWLFLGKEADVSLGQVKKAMETWTKANRKSTTVKAARQAANQLMRSIAIPDALGKREFVEALAQMHRKGNFDEGELLYWLKDGLVNKRRKEKKPVFKEPLTPDLLHKQLLSRQSVMENIYQMEDAIWEWARALILVGASERQREDPQTLKKLMSSSCANLITVLAIAHMITHFDYPTALPAYWQPSVWLEGQMAANIKICFETSPLALPLDNRPKFSLEIIFSHPQILMLHPDILK